MLSAIFKSLVQVRNAAYTLGVLGSARLDGTVISVGNITVGGTGKTPLVTTLAETLIEDGEKVCILTRGYGRKSPTRRVIVSDGNAILASADDAGDEPFEIAERLAGRAIIIADANRVGAARFATEKYSPTVFILDDGFQHRKILRDLDIVCVDATNPFGNCKTLPFGILREPVSNLKRAQKIVITRSNLVSAEELASIRSLIEATAPESDVIVTTLTLRDFRSVGGADTLKTGSRFFAFCGLGNPENFYSLLKKEGHTLVATHSFRDHHIYTQGDVDNVEEMAKAHGAEILLTTTKDAVKLSGLKFVMPCFAAGADITFPENDKLRLLQDAARSK